jgi:hypothetical protein
MQIARNTTGMLAELNVVTDKEGRDHCLVVAKGTFTIEKDGTSRLADEQQAFAFADTHYGDPAQTSIKYESDFAPFKPRADIIVNGLAFAPRRKPATEVLVGLQFGNVKKIIRVTGDRHWDKGVAGLRPSDAQMFVTMPVIYERAFGGSDHTHPNPSHHGSDLRNPLGVGFRKNSDPRAILDTPLPNLEDPANAIRVWNERPAPMGFGVVGRGWQPRIKYAGTYDERWLDERFPILPEDFDTQYFLCAPADQQVPSLRDGDIIRCANMAPDPIVSFSVPKADLPITFRFRDKDVGVQPTLDTIIVEPDKYRFIANWRATVPLGRKLNALREVLVGEAPPAPQPRLRNGKPYFRSLSELAKWRQAQKDR